MKIIGQKHITHYLSEGLKRKKLSPSLLFIGADGVGKRTVSIELAKALACSEKSDPWKRCDNCQSCDKINNRNHPDLLVVNAELQANLVKGKPETQRTVKIESVRHVTKFLTFKPLEMNRRIVVIENAHTMTIEAANALLKILEEPLTTSLIILVVEDESNLPSTIMSRCALLRFHPIPTKDIANWLKSNESLSSEEALPIAEQSGGSLSKALKLIDQDPVNLDLDEYSLDEFFDSVSSPSFRREGRKKAEELLNQLTTQAQQKLASGDLSQKDNLLQFLQAKKYLNRYVPPRLVMENLFLKLQREKIF